MLDKKVCILHEVKSSDFYTKIETENGKKAEKRKEMERQRMFCGNGRRRSIGKQKEKAVV